jgi:hypothetical protein
LRNAPLPPLTVVDGLLEREPQLAELDELLGT